MSSISTKPHAQCTHHIQRLGRKCKHSVKNGKKCYQHVKLKYPRPKTCQICDMWLYKYNYPPGECGHWVCMNCIIRSGKAECPMCRQSVVIRKKDRYMFNYYRSSFRDHVEQTSLELYIPTEEVESVLDYLIESVS